MVCCEQFRLDEEEIGKMLDVKNSRKFGGKQEKKFRELFSRSWRQKIIGAKSRAANWREKLFEATMSAKCFPTRNHRNFVYTRKLLEKFWSCENSWNIFEFIENMKIPEIFWIYELGSFLVINEQCLDSDSARLRCRSKNILSDDNFPNFMSDFELATWTSNLNTSENFSANRETCDAEAKLLH